MCYEPIGHPRLNAVRQLTANSPLKISDLPLNCFQAMHVLLIEGQITQRPAPFLNQNHNTYERLKTS